MTSQQRRSILIVSVIGVFVAAAIAMFVSFLMKRDSAMAAREARLWDRGLSSDVCPPLSVWKGEKLRNEAILPTRQAIAELNKEAGATLFLFEQGPRVAPAS